MRQALVIQSNDVIKILAKYFNVRPEDIIKNKYSYTVMIEKKKKEKIKTSFYWKILH